MTILGVDLSSNNRVFDFGLAWSQGCRAAYIKLGGDNIARYVSGSYAGRVDQARAAGMIVGHYWVTGRHDPEAAAQFFVRNLRNPQSGDFFVLDNEKLDDGNMYSDDEAARWIRTVQALVGGDPRRVFMYASGSPLKSSSWAGVRSTGAQALVAWYGVSPFGFGRLGSWPAEQIGGHQYTSSGSLGGGYPMDLNMFADDAFNFTGVAGGGGTPIPTGDEFDMASLADLSKIVNDRAALTEDRLRRESRPARLYKRMDGTLWIAGPTVVPRQLKDTAEFHDLDIAKGDALFLGAGDVLQPQSISDTAWKWLVAEHEAFRDAIADAVVAKLAAK